MSEQWEPSVAGEADLDSLIRLQHAVYPDRPWSREYVAWQHFHGPAGPSRLHVIRDAGRIVALYCGVPRRFDIGAQSSIAYLVQDVMTHPDYRNRGHLHVLARAFESGVRSEARYAFTFPNQFSENSFRRTGWLELMNVPWCRAAARSPARPVESVRPVDSFSPATASIWRTLAAVGTRRDSDYLNWRFAKPGVEYHRFVIGEERGFLVLKVYEEGGERVVNVCELLVGLQDAQALSDALAHAHRFSVEIGAQALTTWTHDAHPYAAAMREHGFQKMPCDRSVFCLGPEEALPMLGDAGNWFLSQSDNDVF